MVAAKVPSSYIEIMAELEEITKEYSCLLAKANDANIPVARYENGREKLTNMIKRLEALMDPIKELGDYFSRADANEYMTCLLNAVRSSLYRHYPPNLS